MNEELLAAVTGNALAGFGVWVLTAALAWSFGLVRARRRRRREIISLVTRAHNVAQSALDQGAYERAWIEKSELPLREARMRYDDLSSQALNLFEPAETEVAFWCAVELYAGWRSPLEWLEDIDAPRRRVHDDWPLLGSSLAEAWELPRPQLLADWANVRWPWDVGSIRGPQYAMITGPGDRRRHALVPPNTDVNTDMVLAYANVISPPKWQPGAWQARNLRKMFPVDEAAAYREHVATMTGRERA